MPKTGGSPVSASPPFPSPSRDAIGRRRGGGTRPAKPPDRVALPCRHGGGSVPARIGDGTGVMTGDLPVHARAALRTAAIAIVGAAGQTGCKERREPASTAGRAESAGRRTAPVRVGPAGAPP